MIYNCKPITQEAEADRSLNSRPAWPPSRVLGQPQLYTETLSQEEKQRWGQGEVTLYKRRESLVSDSNLRGKISDSTTESGLRISYSKAIRVERII